jgi:hypothetical protein
MKKIILITLAAVILLFTSAKLYYIRGHFGLGIKQCPTAWIDNQMSSTLTSGERQYLIINGKNYQASEVNVKWIQANCEISKPSVAS